MLWSFTEMNLDREVSLAGLCFWKETPVYGRIGIFHKLQVASNVLRKSFIFEGLGRGNGMCDRNQSCSMARDDYSSVIIAHEIAHT